ncbi:unnamed protein product [Rotaria sp. Silwood1]|nr:unnamed protein product [Rotaria sp. Silwood1]CAF1600485.1 unnamed protein product [Rotaria sp. Silwood1]CAF3706781.1 unnamed protein product [Rotaria sp. Silwood1]CAF4835704.1 unnamed protein product [Rotaria sp. Silwood1]
MSDAFFSACSYCDLFAESAGLCSDDNTTNVAPIFLVTFGAGSATFSLDTPANLSFTTSYHQLFANPISDGDFAFTNVVPSSPVVWHGGAVDHTPNDSGGYMFLANADPNPGEFYKDTVDNLCIGQRYEFSVYLTNIVRPYGLAKPNVLFEIRTATSDNTLIAQKSSGDIPEYSSMTWTKYGISFVATNTSVVLLMISNTPNGGGNDMALDDIAFSICSNASSGVCSIG